jgi:uncharacterized membrane protein SpoIIM required for sporulation
MTEQQFIKINSSTWRELEHFSIKINKKGIRALTSNEVKAFLHLFRQSSHHLAFVRTHYPQSNIISYLNSLITKCHSHVYAVKKISPVSLLKYIGYEFPALIREYKWFILGAFGIFIIGFIASILLVSSNPDNARLFLPANILDSVKQTKGSGAGQWNDPLMSSYIMVNNITVALKAFVMGITLGIGTIYVLFYNGAMLGALTSIIYMYGKPLNFWSLIMPHGITELTAIFISGAAGLLVAKSMLLPGEHTRLHSLIKGSKQAISLLAGVIFMLVIAGIIEGFFTPLKISAVTKLIFAGITGLVIAVYFTIPYLVKNVKN